MAINWKQITQDFQQRFEGTWIRVQFKNQKKKEIFLLETVEASLNGPPKLILKNNSCGHISLLYDTESAEIYFEYPEVGYFLHKNMALIIYRNYFRQWKRGINPSTIIITNPYSRIYTFKNPKIEEELLQAAFQSNYIKNLNQASTVLRDNISYPLTREFAIGHHLENIKGKYLIWYYNNTIGTYNYFDNTVSLFSEIFKQEFIDYLNKSKQSDIKLT